MTSDELRDIESQRKVELKHIARKQAKKRARIAAQEAKELEQAERDAAELLHLQEQRDADERSRRILEAQIAADARSTEALQSRVRLLEAAAIQPSPAMVVQSNANKIHARWALALLGTCAAFFLIANQGGATSPQPSAGDGGALDQAIAALPDCPEPSPAALPPTPAASSLAPTDDPVPASWEPRTHSRKHSRRRGRPDAKKDNVTQPIRLDDCDPHDPLSCLPK